jgi:hypothetical protein
MKSVCLLLFSIYLFANYSFSPLVEAQISSGQGPSPTPTPAITAAAPADTASQDWNTVRNEVNGIAIADSGEKVIKRFGKPLSVKKHGTNPCGGNKTVLHFPGIKFTLDEEEGEGKIVVGIEISSSKWEIAPGVRIGFTLEEVRAKMGRLGTLSRENGTDVLSYGDGDGYLTYTFRNEKLVKIMRNLNMC